MLGTGVLVFALALALRPARFAEPAIAPETLATQESAA
jgi:hypothetical protein